MPSWDSFPDYFAERKLHKDDLRYPGGECGQDVWNQCNVSLIDIVRSNASCIAVVTHGGTIRVTICGILGIVRSDAVFRAEGLEDWKVPTNIYWLYVDDEYDPFIHRFDYDEGCFY